MTSSAAASITCCRPIRSPSSLPTSRDFHLNILGIFGITMIIPPMLIAAIVVAKDTPEMLAATVSGSCVCQPSPNHRTPREQAIKDRTNREQKALPVNLMFSLTALPMVRPMTRISLISSYPLVGPVLTVVCLTRFGILSVCWYSRVGAHSRAPWPPVPAQFSPAQTRAHGCAPLRGGAKQTNRVQYQHTLGIPAVSVT